MRARVSSFVAAAALILSLGLQTSVMAAATAPLVLGSRGLDVAHLGSREVVAEQAFTQLLGRPSTPLTSTPGLSNCGLDAMSSWHAFSAYFDHGRMVAWSDCRSVQALHPSAEPQMDLHLATRWRARECSTERHCVPRLTKAVPGLSPRAQGVLKVS